MTIMSRLIFLFFMAIFSSLAFAQSIDTAIIATDIASVDLMVAKAAGEKAGLPVLVTQNGLVTQDMIEQLKDMNVKTVILIGGPAVIKAETEASLKDRFEIIRLWGFERTGTAIEVAKFFWPEGSNCTVLSEDTKNADADTELHLRASLIASLHNCPLLPVPRGDAPAEVLDLLSQLNTSVVDYFGADVSQIRLKIAHLILREMSGDIKKILKEVEDEIEAETKAEGRRLKLVIVAAPSWRESLSIGALPSENSVVRIVTNISQLPELIGIIKAKNITVVKVVGIPALAQQIADGLRDANITVRRVSGDRASFVAKEILKDSKAEWQGKRNKAKEIEIKVKIMTKQRLLALINETDAWLEEELVEIEGLSAEGAPNFVVSSIKERLSVAIARLSDLKSLIEAGRIDEALKLEIKLKGDILVLKWNFKDEIKLKVSEKIEAEERGTTDIDAQVPVEALEARLAGLRLKCDVAGIHNLLKKARELRQETKDAIAAGNYTKAAKLLVEARRTIKAARHLAEVCDKRGKIEEKLEKIAEKKIERIDDLRKIAKKIEKIEEKAMPKIRIKSPKDGEVLGATIVVSVDAENIDIVQPQDQNNPRQGHFHVYLDSANELRGAKKSFTYENISEGAHEIRVELHNNDHTLFMPPVNATVMFTVKIEKTAAMKEFMIEANDTAFYLNNAKLSLITVKKDDKVRITFKVRDEVYFGGLAFRSNIANTVNTGDMKKGDSKTVEFTADSTFNITSYWPASGVKKADLMVNVE